MTKPQFAKPVCELCGEPYTSALHFCAPDQPKRFTCDQCGARYLGMHACPRPPTPSTGPLDDATVRPGPEGEPEARPNVTTRTVKLRCRCDRDVTWDTPMGTSQLPMCIGCGKLCYLCSCPEMPYVNAGVDSEAATPETAPDTHSLSPGAAGEAIPLDGRVAGEQVKAQHHSRDGYCVLCWVPMDECVVVQLLVLRAERMDWRAERTRLMAVAEAAERLSQWVLDKAGHQSFACTQKGRCECGMFKSMGELRLAAAALAREVTP